MYTVFGAGRSKMYRHSNSSSEVLYLYGCEWSALTSAELFTLERAHRFCIKRMQSFDMRTRTDIAVGLLVTFPLEVEIDIRKLVLFGQLCQLNSNFWVKTMFLCMRFFSCVSNGFVHVYIIVCVLILWIHVCHSPWRK